MTLTPGQRQIRMNIRNFLLVATDQELQIEHDISVRAGDSFRADCIKELMEDCQNGTTN